MEINKFAASAQSSAVRAGSVIKGLFVKGHATHAGAKQELNFQAFKVLGAMAFVGFIATVLITPDDPPLEFSQKAEADAVEKSQEARTAETRQASNRKSVPLWGSPSASGGVTSGRGAEINYNTSMLLTQKNGNAKNQLRPGSRFTAKLMDKTIISQDAVPVLAVLQFDAATESGLMLPQGSKLYGEASFEKGSERARIHFTQVSLPSGELRPISGAALGQDGQVGIAGRVFSDGVKNTTGELMTTFIAGLATGSMQTNFLGASQGGIKNGLLSAAGQTAQGRAQAYGQKLKTEREWIELQSGTVFDAVLTESLNLQRGGENE